MSRSRGERSEKAELEDIKILKRRNRMLERENQRLRKELRRYEVSRSFPTDDEPDWTPPVGSKKKNVKCECGSEETILLEVSVMGKPKKYLLCQTVGCNKRRRVE